MYAIFPALYIFVQSLYWRLHKLVSIVVIQRKTYKLVSLERFFIKKNIHRWFIIKAGCLSFIGEFVCHYVLVLGSI